MNAKLLFIATAIAGLLLGGNVLADGSQTISNAQAQATIQQLRARVQILTQQVQAQKALQAAPIVKPNLTPEQIASIQTQIIVIGQKITQLKIEVQKFVQIQQIKQKIAALRQIQIDTIKTQIARLNAQIKAKQTTGQPAPIIVGGVQAVPVASGSDSSKSDKKEIEAQIAKVKEQISQITQEMETQKTLEEANENQSQSVNQNDNKCEGQSCSSNTQSSQQPAQKGFWQSVGDFLRKIFSF
jgi:hypothetical protein